MHVGGQAEPHSVYTCPFISQVVPPAVVEYANNSATGNRYNDSLYSGTSISILGTPVLWDS